MPSSEAGTHSLHRLKARLHSLCEGRNEAVKECYVTEVGLKLGSPGSSKTVPGKRSAAASVSRNVNWGLETLV